MFALTTGIQHHTRGPSLLNKAKKKKGIWIRKEGIQFSLFVDDVIIYLGNPTIYKKGTSTKCVQWVCMFQSQCTKVNLILIY